MSRRITAGNDAPFRWAVKLQGKPFDLSGKDVKIYVINSRGEIPVAQLTIEGHEVSGVFEGRYQTRLGEHSLVLRVNEGRPEMKTAAVANVFELVQWSTDAGGSDESDVIVAPVLIESELRIGGGSSYDDTEVKNELARLEREKADKQELTELSERIDNLPTAEDEILVVEYGKTTFQEVHDAYYAGKYIIFEFANNVFHINRVTASDIYFISVNGTIVYRIWLKSSNDWYQNTVQNEQSTNKVTTLSESSTDTQYPSAKAVYEALQNVGGGEQEVFWATEGITDASKGTTYDEILAAHNAGKVVKCLYQKIIFDLRYVTNILYFAANVNNNLYYLKCPQSNKWQYSTENTEHKLETLENGNAKITIAGKTAEVATPQYVENAIQQSGGGGASSDKQGVIRQTQTWTQAADKGYDYVMSDLVKGAIPQANIDLFTSAGAVFNEESGYFELNGLTDISYEEMSAIYNAGFKMVEGYWGNNIRTNIFRSCNVYNAADAQLYGFVGMYANRNCKAESFKFTEQEINGVALKSQMYGTYEGCKYLKTFGKGVFSCHDSTISDLAFTQCYSLETIYLRSLKKNIWFKDSARLSEASVLYMVANSAATSAIVITLHADAYARAMADTEIQAALEAHPNVSLASA